MKTTNQMKTNLTLAAAAILAAGTLQAADLYWDGGTIDIVTDGDGASDGGDGTWNTTLLNWDEGASAHVAWNNANNDNAIFGGTSGTVTIDTGGVTVGGVQFDTANYTITGDPLTFGVAGDIENNGTATIASDLAGSVGLSKTGTGELNMTYDAYSFTGDISVGGGKLDFSNGNDSVARSLGGGNFAGNIDIASGATFQFWKNGESQEFSGVISGDGDLRLAYNSTYTLSGANTYTGKTTFHGEYNGRTATVNVSSINSVNGGTPAMASSSLGAPTTAENGTIVLGRGGMQANAILNYTGPGETTDRIVNLYASGNSTKTVNNLGTGTLTFTSPWTAPTGTGLRVPITTDADLILDGFSIPGQARYLQKRGAARLSVSGDCEIWDYVQLYGGTLEIDSEINDGGVYQGAIATGPGLGGANFIGVPDTSILAVGMTVSHGKLLVGTTITEIIDATTAKISTNAQGPDKTESGAIGFKGALGIFLPDPVKLRWVNSATLKYTGPDDSTDRGFMIDFGDTATWEVTSANLTVSGGTAATSGNLTKTGAGTLTLAGTQQYTGATTVSVGTLALAGGSQTSPITVASGASIGFTLGSPTTSTSSLDLTTGTVKITGAVDNASDYQLMTASSITGTPTLDSLITDYELQLQNSDTELWLVYTGSASGYGTWAATNAPSGTPKDDFDGDGVSNELEFVLGGDKDTNDLDKLPAVSTSGGDMVFTFERDQDSIDGSTVVTIEVGPDLASWPGSYTVGAHTAGSSAGVTVSQDDPVAGTDTVTLTVTQAPDAKKFARLKVVVTP